jgi:hypothetical protein
VSLEVALCEEDGQHKVMLSKIYTELVIVVSAELGMSRYTTMLKGYVKIAPYDCIFCGNRIHCDIRELILDY